MLGRLFSKLLFWRGDKAVIAVVRLKGVIAPSTGGVRKSLNLETLEPQLKKAFSIGNIKAVALVINSPGGSPVQSQLIADRIRQLASKNDTPVIAFCEDAAASGGYWLACAADEIYASPASIIGSIGVVSSGFGFPDLLSKIGVERRVYTAGTSKAMLDPFQPEKEADVSHLKSLQAQLHDHFISYIKSRRGGKITAPDDEVFTGAFWSGSTALELGLIDAIGNLHQVMAQKFGQDYRLVTMSAKSNFSLLSALSSSASPKETMMGDATDAVINKLDERSWWSRLGL